MHRTLVGIMLLAALLTLIVLPALAQAPVPPGVDIGAGTSTDAPPTDQTTNSIVIVAVLLAVVAIIVALATRKKIVLPPGD